MYKHKVDFRLHNTELDSLLYSTQLGPSRLEQAQNKGPPIWLWKCDSDWQTLFQIIIWESVVTMFRALLQVLDGSMSAEPPDGTPRTVPLRTCRLQHVIAVLLGVALSRRLSINSPLWLHAKWPWITMSFASPMVRVNSLADWNSTSFGFPRDSLCALDISEISSH